jgi:AraC-like DNA-binding protein
MTPRWPQYHEVRPGPVLLPYVQCYWSLIATAAPSFWTRVCPDVCADIIVDLSARLPPAARVDGARTYAVGTMRQASRVPLGGNIHLLGVRFRPSVAELFFRLPMHQLTDRTVPLPDIWDGAALLECLVAEAPTAADRISRLEAVLLERLRRAPEPAPAIRQAIGFIARTAGTRSVRELAETVGLGGRHLERRFRDAVGVSPKLFSRVVRFRRALALLRRPNRPPWPQLAAEAGYFDQAHLIREVRALAGTTPTALAIESSQVGSVQYESEITE